MSTGTITVVNGNDIQIGGGQVLDGKLFHSFAEFNLKASQTAYFYVSAEINSIVVIVDNPKKPSIVSGTIELSANVTHLYLWNPSGTTFLANTKLNPFSDSKEIDAKDPNTFNVDIPARIPMPTVVLTPPESLLNIIKSYSYGKILTSSLFIHSPLPVLQFQKFSQYFQAAPSTTSLIHSKQSVLGSLLAEVTAPVNLVDVAHFSIN
jgi:filamentous hemagglutinin family protein